MKKRYFYFALAAASALFALLSACGEGMPVNLDNSYEWKGVQESVLDMVEDNGRIKECNSGKGYDCPEYPDRTKPQSSSSSFEEEPITDLSSSSSSEGVSSSVEVSSSSEVLSSSSVTPSSSSVTPSSSSVTPSSSSVTPSSSSVKPSSSSVAPSSSSVTPSSSSVAPSSSSVTPSSSSVAPSSSSNSVPPGQEENSNLGDCEYRWNMCSPDGTTEKGWPLEIVKKDMEYSSYPIKNACVFVKNVTNLAGGTYKINGSSHTVSNENTLITGLPQSKDGGYYIWVPEINVDNANKFKVTKGTPECTPGTPTNAVAICKSYCADRADGATVTGIEQNKVYQLRVYGNENCTNFRSVGNSTSCNFKLNGTQVSKADNDNIGSVDKNTSATIEYLGGSGCPTTIGFKCN